MSIIRTQQTHIACSILAGIIGKTAVSYVRRRNLWVYLPLRLGRSHLTRTNSGSYLSRSHAERLFGQSENGPDIAGRSGRNDKIRHGSPGGTVFGLFRGRTCTRRKKPTWNASREMIEVKMEFRKSIPSSSLLSSSYIFLSVSLFEDRKMFDRKMEFRTRRNLCEFHCFRLVVDLQTMAIQEHRTQKRKLPIVGYNLRLVRIAEPIEKTRERFQLDRMAVRQDSLSGRLLH